MEAVETLEPTSITAAISKPKLVIVKEVWSENLCSELMEIRRLVDYYNVVTIDTEFPGTIHKERGYKSEASSYNYDLMKANVDDLKIIQLGVTLSDFNGNMPDFGYGISYIWQFNFCDFDIDKDPYDPDSIELLKRQGIDFMKNKKKGISSTWFRALFLRIFDEVNLTWLTFHGGYDFAYLIKILSKEKLPCDLPGFVVQLGHYFGSNVYDLKTIMSQYKLYGGLEKLAKKLGVERVAGESHQAGSDSLLTMQTFMKLKKQCFANEFEATIQQGKFTEYGWQLYGLKVVVLLNCYDQVYKIFASDLFESAIRGEKIGGCQIWWTMKAKVYAL